MRNVTAVEADPNFSAPAKQIRWPENMNCGWQYDDDRGCLTQCHFAFFSGLHRDQIPQSGKYSDFGATAHQIHRLANIDRGWQYDYEQQCPEREHRDRDQFQKTGKDRDLCARGLHSLNTFSGKYGLQQGQRILDRIVIYRILYANSITARVFCTGKVLVPIFYCPFLYFYQEPIVLRTDSLLYYFFYQVLKISIIPSLVFFNSWYISEIHALFPLADNLTF